MVPMWNTTPALRRAALMLARPPGGCLRAEVGVHVLVVRLEDANGEMMIEQRRLVVHAAADRQSRSPRERVVIRAVNQRAAHQTVNERGDVRRWDSGRSRRR